MQCQHGSFNWRVDHLVSLFTHLVLKLSLNWATYAPNLFLQAQYHVKLRLDMVAKTTPGYPFNYMLS